MRVMADSSAHPEQEDVPRAPPPSPEFPHRQSQQFNFAELLTIASLHENSPASSTEHSRPTSPLFYHSPDHTHPPSGSLSPLEEADSPYSFSSKLSELTLSIDACHEMRNGICHPNQMPGKQLICGSLPVNGEMHAYMQQHESRFSNSDFRQLLESDQNDTTSHNLTERRRKISLKRQHDNQEEYFYDTKSPGIEIINKKLCHGNDRVGSAPSHAQRSHTFSGASTCISRPFQKPSQNLSLNTNGAPFHVGSLPVDRLGNHLPPTVTHKNPSSDCLSPGGLRTVGFSTNEITNTEYQMEGVETEGERDVPPTSIPISVTQMDWNNGGISLTSNVPSTLTGPQNMTSGFSFGLPHNYSTSYEPSPLSFHLNVPGFDSMPVGGFLSGQQDQSIPQITLTPHHFSKSL